ncbi:unnamed protein product [Rhizoctonia solani]|uniref:F-box domain-containing protein n=1 Tax=Rhizoctonia solani TaxID=456999 RepID=A0A8H3HAF9_9AGAM|nr:unnamed protein product [Rhizoctonia solani]
MARGHHHMPFSFTQVMQLGSKDLPLEIVQMILSLIPRKHLPSISLVCKSWRSMIFPVMYQFVRLLSAKDHEVDHLPEYIRARFENCPENLVDRIELQADIDWQSMQFSSCIRHLRVEWKMNEQQLQSFGSAVLKLKTLEHLDWKVSAVDSSKWYNILVQFVEKLPQIQSLKLTLPLNDIHLDDSGEIIDLANLKSLTIELDQYTGKQPDEQVPSNIIRLICGARNIESLALDIEVDFTLMEDLYLDWEAEDMFAAIFSHQFPRLPMLLLVFGNSFRGTHY